MSSVAMLLATFYTDVTPDTLAWDTISKTNFNSTPTNTAGNTQTITGINTAITLGVSSILDVPPATLTPTLACFKNGVSEFSLLLSETSDSNTVVVVNGDTIQFKLSFSGTFPDSCENTITVTNENTSTTLDTFTTFAARE